jgi:hypothetical protein
MTTSSLRADIARAVGARLERIMPPSQRAWAEDMKAEIEAIEAPGAALSFALGCLGAGVLRRARTLSGVLIAARTTVGGLTVLFSVAALTTALRFTGIGDPAALPLFTALLGLAFLVAGMTMLRKGPAALAVVAATMLVLNTLAFWTNGRLQPLHADVQHALIMEGYLLWTALLLTGALLYLCSRSGRLSALAERHGWGD